MADPCAELLFHYRGAFEELSTDGYGANQRARLFRSGTPAQTSVYRRFTIAERFGIVGVYVYPDAVDELIGLPASEPTDQMPDLASTLGATGRELEQRVCTSPDNAARVRVLSEFLSQRLIRRQTGESPGAGTAETDGRCRRKSTRRRSGATVQNLRTTVGTRVLPLLRVLAQEVHEDPSLRGCLRSLLCRHPANTDRHRVRLRILRSGAFNPRLHGVLRVPPFRLFLRNERRYRVEGCDLDTMGAEVGFVQSVAAIVTCTSFQTGCRRRSTCPERIRIPSITAR